MSLPEPTLIIIESKIGRLLDEYRDWQIEMIDGTIPTYESTRATIANLMGIIRYRLMAGGVSDSKLYEALVQPPYEAVIYRLAPIFVNQEDHSPLIADARKQYRLVEDYFSEYRYLNSSGR